MKSLPPILPGYCYHLYNHSNGYLDLFRCEDNFRYFIQKYVKYVHPFVDTFAFCLMPNHFHFLIRVKESLDDENVFLKKGSEVFKTSDPSTIKNPITPRQVTNSIKNWLLSYTTAYHKVYGTKGNLFRQKINRKFVNDETYFSNLVLYIHLNPVIHGFSNTAEDWENSSYIDFLNDADSFINKTIVFEIFESRENFKSRHEQKMLVNIDELLNSDFN